MRQAVLAEAHPLAEAAGDLLVTILVIEHSRTLPDTEEPKKGNEFGIEADGQFDHSRSRPLALAPEKTEENQAGDPGDTEPGQPEKSQEEDFQRKE